MRIKRLILSDFGKFHQEEFLLSPGLNIATGANESGKTTLRRFIRSMFYGLERERGIKARKDEYTRLKPWEYGRFQGSMELEAEGKTYRLYRNFLTTEKDVRMTELSSGKDVDNPSEALKQLGLMSEAVYTNTFWVGNACITESLLGTEIKDYLANLAYSGGTGLNLQKSLGWLVMKRKELMRQIPEQELAECVEVLLTKEELKEQLIRERRRIEESLRRKKELEGAIKVKKGLLEQMAVERKQAETEEKKRFQGERLLILLCALAVGLGSFAFILPTWAWRLVMGGIGFFTLAFGLFKCLPLIERGRQAERRKEELGEQLTAKTQQMERYYQELTGLLPEMEKQKLRMEQIEEQLKHCELTEERYEELKRQQQSLLQEADAILLAHDTLERLSVELYEEFGAKFARALSEYAQAFTDGAYAMLTADDDLNLKAITQERSLDVSDVSFGTGEQFYLALRFAAADVFDPEKKNTIILDDSFAAFDEQRLESAILALAKSGRQILVLSSTGREEAAAKRMGITYAAVF